MTCSVERMDGVGRPENTQAQSGGGYLCSGCYMVSSCLHTPLSKILKTLLSI